MNNRIRSLLTPWTAAAALALWSLLFAACSSTTEQHTAVTAPAVAGATFVGSKECATCHAEKAAHFVSASHAKMSVTTADGKDAGSCEACHGPASLHVAAGDGKHIINPGRSAEACFRCHLDKRSQFSLPHSHQVLNGKMSCLDCHEVHEGNAVKGSGATSLEGENETCTKCHTAQKGPFIFTHQAMKEGCVACHNPHGTVNQKMLVQRDANLCLRCHLNPQVVAGDGTIMAGAQDHRTRIQAGNCWIQGCHETVHGSNASKALRY